MDRRQFLLESLAGIGGVMCGSLAFAENRTTQVKHLGGYTYSAVIARADVPNGNKRIYPREVLDMACRQFACDHKKTRSLMGELGMPTDSIIHLNKVSHVIADLQISGDYMVAKIEVIDTPNGKILKKLLMEAPETVAFRTQGIGNGTCDENGIFTIKDNYKLISIHALSAQEAVKI